MDEQEKLPRLYRFGGYTTGDDQAWTYEYTWEDLEAAVMFRTTIMSDDVITQQRIFDWFKEDPSRVTPEVREHISDVSLLYAGIPVD